MSRRCSISGMCKVAGNDYQYRESHEKLYLQPLRQFMAEAEQVGTDFAKLCYSAPTNERRVA